MFANQLIGKLAIRTDLVDRGPRDAGFGTGVVVTNVDNSFTDRPIHILAATESHIVYKFTEEYDKMFVDGRRRVLNYEFCDNKWTSWDDLMSLADDNHMELMKKLQD